MQPAHKARQPVYGRMIDAVFLAGALLLGLFCAWQGWAAVLPFLLGMAGFGLLRFAWRRPFHEAFAVYLALSAFNYYYFYCAQFTGRNPTDFGDWGTPATTLEKLQKDIALFALLGLAVFKLAQNHFSGLPLWLNARTGWQNPLLRLTGLFAVFTLLRGLFWVFEGEQLFDLLYYMRANLAFAVLPILMGTVLMPCRQAFLLCCKAMAWMLPVVSALGVVEFLLHGSPYQRSFGGGEMFYRAVSTLQNPNNLGGYLATMVGMMVVLYGTGALNRWERLGFWLAMPLGVTCLFMTLSRSTLLFGFIALVLYGLVNWWCAPAQKAFSIANGNTGPKRAWMWIALAGLVVSGLALLKFFDFQSALRLAIEQYADPFSEQGSYRIYAPLAIFQKLLENPWAFLFGASWSAMPYASDNAFATVLLRNGLVGFSLYAAIWLQAMKVCVWALKMPQPDVLYKIGFYVLMFQFLYAFSAPIHENFPHNLYFWFMVGMLAWLESKPPAKSPVNMEGDVL